MSVWFTVEVEQQLLEEDPEEQFRRYVPWDDLVQRFGPQRVRYLFDGDSRRAMENLIRQALRRNADFVPPRYRLAFQATPLPEVESADLARFLNECAGIESASVVGPCFSAAAAHPNLPPSGPTLDMRPYLGPAPNGINAVEAWKYKGGEGQNVQIAILEYGWDAQHPNLAGADIARIHKGKLGDPTHGTKVLGVIAGQPGTGGGKGAAPLAKVRMFPILSLQAVQHSDRPVHDCIALMADAVDEGDVLVIEQETAGIDPSYTFGVPIEFERPSRVAILAATAAGRVVVEPAGNYGRSLDDLVDAKGRFVFGPQFDSGAVIVGAAKFNDALPREVVGNYGARVDCYAWGEDVYTAFPTGGLELYGYFGWTSAATAIVGGAAACVQSMAKALYGEPFGPRHVRRLLKAGGHHNEFALKVGGNGVIPNIGAVARDLFA